MAAAVPILMIGGALMSAVGSAQAAKAQRTASLYNAQLNEQNALLSEDQAHQDAARIRQEGAKQIGMMEAEYGAAGVSLEGSPLAALANSQALVKLDEETIQYRGKLRSIGYYNSATLDRLNADTAQTQGDYQSASSLLTGAGHAAYTYAASDSRLYHRPSGSGTEIGDGDWGF